MCLKFIFSTNYVLIKFNELDIPKWTILTLTVTTTDYHNIVRNQIML